MVLLFPQLHLPRTSFLTAGDLPSWGHMGMGPSHGYLFSAGQHRPGESRSAPLLAGAFQHRREGMPLPSSPGCSSLACQLLLGQIRHTEHPLAQGASGQEGAKGKGDPVPSTDTATAALGATAHPGEGGGVAQPFLCTLNHSPFFIMALLHLFAAHQL